MSAHFAISRTAARHVYPTGRAVWWGNFACHYSRLRSAARSIVAEEAGTWISGADCSRTTTRRKTAAAAAAAAEAGMSWRGQTYIYRQLEFFVSRQHRGAEGNV